MKQAIVNDLQKLMNAGVLGAVVIDNGTKRNPADYDFVQFPAAVISAADVPSSEYYDTRTNLRDYVWYVMVVLTEDTIPANSTSYFEGLMDAVLNQFDGDVTLQGMANGGVSAASLTPPGPIAASAITYAGFILTLKARQLVQAGVQS